MRYRLYRRYPFVTRLQSFQFEVQVYIIRGKSLRTELAIKPLGLILAPTSESLRR